MYVFEITLELSHSFNDIGYPGVLDGSGFKLLLDMHNFGWVWGTAHLSVFNKVYSFSQSSGK